MMEIGHLIKGYDNYVDIAPMGFLRHMKSPLGVVTLYQIQLVVKGGYL